MKQWAPTSVGAIASALLLAPAIAMADSAFDGHWMTIKADKSLDVGSLVTYKVQKDRLEMTTASGLSYKAKLNGAEARMEGSPVPIQVSVTMPSKTVLVEVLKRDGQPWQTTRVEVQGDGKSAKVTWKNLKAGKGDSHEIVKQ